MMIDRNKVLKAIEKEAPKLARAVRESIKRIDDECKLDEIESALIVGELLKETLAKLPRILNSKYI
jgi:hypothetical protein